MAISMDVRVSERTSLRLSQDLHIEAGIVPGVLTLNLYILLSGDKLLPRVNLYLGLQAHD